jgi:hypothetical protein
VLDANEGGGRWRPASPGIAEGWGGPIGIGIEADFGGVEFCLPLVFVIVSEARSGSSRDLFLVRRDGCGLPGDGDKDFSRSLVRGDIVDGRFDVLVVDDDVEAVLPILNLLDSSRQLLFKLSVYLCLQQKVITPSKNNFGYGESNPELPRSLRGGNVSRYTIPDYK